MDILNACVKRQAVANDAGMIEAVVTLRIRDEGSPNPFEVDVTPCIPRELAASPAQLHQRLLRAAIEAV